MPLIVNYYMVWSEYFKMQKSTNTLNLIEIVGDILGLGLRKSKKSKITEEARLRDFSRKTRAGNQPPIPSL